MAPVQNIRNIRADSEDSSIRFNPFRLLAIGESMIRYSDGIRIKDFLFLAIITSNRLLFVDSAKQNEGLIAKEIPISVIQKAVIERDEKNRPILVLSMPMGEQTRILRMVFTGLISEPETECREWYSAITGTRFEDVETVSPPVTAPEEKPVTPIVMIKTEPDIIGSQEKEIREEKIPVVPAITSDSEKEPVVPVPKPAEAQKPFPVGAVAVKRPEPVPVPKRSLNKQEQKKTTYREESVQIFIEKPSISPVSLGRKMSTPVGSGKGKNRFCLHCGARIPGHARFCPVCGKTQT